MSLSNPVLGAMVEYLVELAMVKSDVVTVMCSLVAASAVYLARATLNVQDSDGMVWSRTLEHYTRYDKSEL
eukprot:4580146-Ditylum_brightwellii.AAC.1